MSTSEVVVARPSRLGMVLPGLAGPLLFVGLWLWAPVYAPLGVLVWLAIYWACGVIPILYTALIVVGCFALLGTDWATIGWSFLHPALLVIIFPALVVLAAVHSGLMERLAIACSNRVGPSVRAQAQFWLAFGTLLSCFSANMVVGIALTPIALNMLRRAGYKTADDLAGSRSAMLIVVAVAVGAGLGGNPHSHGRWPGGHYLDHA